MDCHDSLRNNQLPEPSQTLSGLTISEQKIFTNAVSFCWRIVFRRGRNKELKKKLGAVLVIEHGLMPEEPARSMIERIFYLQPRCAGSGSDQFDRSDLCDGNLMENQFASQPVTASLIYVSFNQRAGIDKPDHYRSPRSRIIVSETGSPITMIGSHSSSES